MKMKLITGLLIAAACFGQTNPKKGQILTYDGTRAIWSDPTTGSGSTGPAGPAGPTGPAGPAGPAGSSGSGGSSCVYKGYWDSAVAYPVSPDTCDTVLYGAAPSTMYQSQAASTNVVPGTDATKWQPVGYIVPWRYRGAYASGTTYVPLDFVTNAGSSYVSLTTSTGQTPPDPYNFPGGNSYWGVLASGSSTTATPVVSTAVSPSTRTLVQGSSVTYTLTFTATALTNTIVPSVTGLPAGVTATYSVNPVANTGGTTVVTLTASSSATVATSTITFTGTSGSVTGSATATLVTDTQANVLTLVSGPTTISSYTVPTGSLDWKLDSQDPNTKKTGSAYIQDVTATASGGGPCGENPYYNAGSSANIAYTNAAGTSAGNSSIGAYPGGSCNIGQTTTITDPNLHQIRVIYWGGGGPSNDGLTITLTTSDGSSTLAPFNDPTAGNDYTRMITFNVRIAAASSGSPQFVRFSLSSYNGADKRIKLVELVN